MYQLIESAYERDGKKYLEMVKSNDQIAATFSFLS
jgi:hypothetical protein